jgi:NAD-dependent SIR2 family protein deacetylase
MTQYSCLQDFVERHRNLFILTGAGCSTSSGIPDYRDADGQWKRMQPVTYQAFMRAETTRRRYWARSLIGWTRVRRARPNDAHRALARLEALGRSELLLTQNVDRLHQAAGCTRVIDLHGRLDLVRCMDCARRVLRDEVQDELGRMNADWLDLEAGDAPDGDADLEDADFSSFVTPSCRRCGGVLKPDVVFFGESVPRDRVDAALRHLEQADATDRRFLADGLFRLPFRPTRNRRWKAGRRDQHRSNSRRRDAHAEGSRGVRNRAGFFIVTAESGRSAVLAKPKL